MGFSNMRTWLFCFALISVLVLTRVEASGTRIKPEVFAPPVENKPPQQANPYDRGCSKYARCRRGLNPSNG